TFVKSGGAGTTSIGVDFDNDGIVQASSGTLSLQSADAAATEVGSFVSAASAVLDFRAGTHKLGAASSVSGAGTISVSGGTVGFGGGYDVAGTTALKIGR